VNRPFLPSITTNAETGKPVAASYYPDDYLLRQKTHEQASGGAKSWPCRLTRCGEHPGFWGEYDVLPLRVVSSA